MFGKSPNSAAQNDTGSDELRIALDNRAFEIQLFWQRSNYFLVLMSALGIGTFSVKDTFFAPIIAAFAAICSYLWFRVNLGSKFWQESWEVEVNLLAKERSIRSFERPMSEVREQVRKSLHDGWSDEKHSVLQRWIDKETTKKFSVTYHMILLSLFSSFLWAVVAVLLSGRLAVGLFNGPERVGDSLMITAGPVSVVESAPPTRKPAAP